MLLESNRIELDAKESRFGYTALHYAAEQGRLDIVRALLEKGANPYVRTNFGFTVFEIAKYEDYDGIAELLKAYM